MRQVEDTKHFKEEINLTCEHLRVNCGTDVIAPPGAQTVTPRSPSMVGPRLVQV